MEGPKNRQIKKGATHLLFIEAGCKSLDQVLLIISVPSPIMEMMMMMMIPH